MSCFQYKTFNTLFQVEDIKWNSSMNNIYEKLISPTSTSSSTSDPKLPNPNQKQSPNPSQTIKSFINFLSEAIGSDQKVLDGDYWKDSLFMGKYIPGSDLTASQSRE